MKYFFFLVLLLPVSSLAEVVSVSSLAGTHVKCVTWSNEILFMSTGADEGKTGDAVVAGCVDHPYTLPQDCSDNLRCFPEQNMVSSWK